MKTNKTIIETLKFHDLYGTEIIFRMMQKQGNNITNERGIFALILKQQTK